MEYDEARNRLERLRRLRPKLGTETTADMLGFLGDPHEDLTCVQIAGSNGKGSTARILERILHETGLEIGCYTSPDLNGLRERIRIGQRSISKQAVTEFVERVWPHVVERSAAGDTPTFFEVVTAMALWEFGRQDVDVAILEVGIGGRYDATSVVDPVAAAVTSISLEHTDIIGSTIEEIAADKVSVAPGDAPLVTGATGRALETIRERTDVVTVGGAMGDGGSTPTAFDDGSTARQSGVGGQEPTGASGDSSTDLDVLARETGMATKTTATVSLQGSGFAIETECPLLGQHQAINAGIAATLARQVATPTDGEIASGIRNVHWPGRFEIVQTEPLVVLDGAHNPAACETVATVMERFDYDDLAVVLGAMREKDHAEMSRSLPEMDRTLVAEPSVDRAQDAETLAAIVERESDAAVTRAKSVSHAVETALDGSTAADAVLVTGSLYVVGEARDRWTRTPRVVRSDTRAQARSTYASADVPAGDRVDLADRTVTRSVRFHARRPVAEDLRSRMLALGGCAGISGVDATDQHVEVVLSGSESAFADLCRALCDTPGDHRQIARQLAEALDLEIERDEPDLPGVVGADRDDQNRPWMDGTVIMGICNVTPDSFHDGGEYDTTAAAVERAREMVAAGAAIVDVGGESTRPGADPVDAATERERVVPVIEALTDLDATVSIDTRKPAVAATAIDAGADVVNDVTGLQDARMRRLVAEEGVQAVLMHSLTAPVDPGRTYPSAEVVDAVLDDLTEQLLLAERAGIDRSQLIVDPGLGFGKDADGSFTLLDRLDEFHALGTPVMVGHSHKSMFRTVSGDGDDRLAPTVAASAMAAERGADVIRVHDVAPNVAAVRTARRTNDPR